MKLTYIYHSCYVLETDAFAIIFDYYKDSGKSPLEGYVHDELLKKKQRLYVLASHMHPDHFNPDVLKWKKEKEDIVYIFSSDILHEGKAKMKDALYLKKGDVYEDGNIHVKAYGSTDVGVSFLLQTEGKQIFHAGDLNNWHWMDYSTNAEVEEAEKAYLYELGLLAKETNALNLAMFPVDPRLGRGYMRGAEQFVSAIRTSLFAPMHFAEAYDKVAAFKAYAEAQHCRLLPLSSKGQTFEL
ncbi:L-ascorbate metabolism protein UlaG (beta-lactamase superfamily) [Parabacteroides sp. PF5-5]|uniref:MBL fold metallo-hydrolase n=1 Tax=unclassified Parabacteroides TaxID=2649774 RepID=UPI0024735D28|nr:MULTISPECIES: MBL fold metallo-hydrolase [unclassified Parabacteroides]MDH6305255.1 L-ascorbate metabolism protein UlaG (beta-lactamase superfamily) [Parabacteroides sp. PH5-39]MDH6316608.1 L-ascorbate metabolism protein UlaG (beta-lactamase superfamily) [Parabacteroides sp. PF5-13]MDH6320212.1 L-ascorbate metabolism protein UlaG (beta-lactamase superfamily) [Parabacteroides sp. PH5-13]MDH6323845.1 L-ascorbate metabolism protein UlaG (beta-lactamase superfamily) [Parabacteroides sp. PH5-8]M